MIYCKDAEPVRSGCPKRPAARSLSWKLQHLGALGLFFLTILDSSPIPTFGGPDILIAVLSASHRNPWYEYAATATLGSMIGAYITFRLARKAGSAYLDQKFKKGKVSKFLNIFKKWGTGTLAAISGNSYPYPDQHVFCGSGRLRLSPGKVSYRRYDFKSGPVLSHRFGRGPLWPPLHPRLAPSGTDWGWLVAIAAITIALIVGGILFQAPLGDGVCLMAGRLQTGVYATLSAT